MSATIDWGDPNAGSSSGTIQYQSGVYTVLGDYKYAEEGNYTIGVTINDVGGSTVSLVTSTAVVADAALTGGVLTPPVATEGMSFGNVTIFHFTDADSSGTVGDYTAVVSLGDGHQVTLTSTPGSNGRVVAHTGGGFD